MSWDGALAKLGDVQQVDLTAINARKRGIRGDGSNQSTQLNALMVEAASAGRQLYMPPGVYVGTNLQPPSGLRWIGNGPLTRIIHDGTTQIVGLNRLTTPSPVANNVKDVRILDIQFEGPTGTPVFADQRHLISVSSISDWTIQGCRFIGHIGDAIFIGSGIGAAAERHNERITIRDCFFDGINNENRQAISVIDVDGLLIENNYVLRCTKSTMPGAFDLEPTDNSFHILKNITVRKNQFNACGGNAGLIMILQAALTLGHPKTALVEDNISEGYVGTGDFFRYASRDLAGTESELSTVRFRNNVAKGGVVPFRIWDGRGVLVESNFFEDFTQGAEIGSTTPSLVPRELRVIGNKFNRVGSSVAYGMLIRRATDLDLFDNDFIDCANGSANAAALAFWSGAPSGAFTAGYSSGIRRRGNRFFNITGKMPLAVYMHPDHHSRRDDNSVRDDKLFGLRDQCPSIGGQSDLTPFWSDSFAGALFDPMDTWSMSANYSGNALAAITGGIGLVLDRRLETHLGPELLANPSLAGGATGWTVTNADATHRVTFASGAMRFEAPTTAQALTVGQTVLTSGRVYESEIEVSALVGSTVVKTDVNAGGASNLVSAQGQQRARFTATGTGFTMTGAANAADATLDRVSLRELRGTHATQQTDANRPTLQRVDTRAYLQFVRSSSQRLATATGGGAASAFQLFWAGRPASTGVQQILWTNRGTNTGLRLEIDASNNVVFSAGNGSSFTTVSSAAVNTFTDYALLAWYDGAALRLEVNGTLYSQAFSALVAGPAGCMLGASETPDAHFDGWLYGIGWRNDVPVRLAELAQLRAWARMKGGVA